MDTGHWASDDGVAPVIGTILLVALAILAGVGLYSAYSDMDANDGAPPPGTVAYMSTPPTATDGGADRANLTLVRAGNGLRYDALDVTLDGEALPCDETPAGDSYRVWSGGVVLACGAGGPEAPLSAGDLLEVHDLGGGLAGKTLRIVDVASNAVIAAVTMR